jgi:phage FluMu protein Com
MIKLECAGCGKKFRVVVSAAGKRFKCPNCKSVGDIPSPAVSQTDSDGFDLDALAALEPTKGEGPSAPLVCSACGSAIEAGSVFNHHGKPVCLECVFLFSKSDATETTSISSAAPPLLSTGPATHDIITTKDCAFCGEEIQSNAKKCKHCGEWLIDAPQVLASRPPQTIATAKVPTCPRCGCQQLQIIKQGYQADNGCCLGLLLGPLGLLCGFAGSGTTYTACVACGYKVMQPTVSNFITSIFMLLFYGAIFVAAMWLLLSK